MDDEEPTASASAIWARKYQYLLDKSSIHVAPRWALFFVLLTIYWLRVYNLGAFYIVTYGLGIYLLNQLIGFISPQFDPEMAEEESLGGGLPTRDSEEYRPFARRLPEFKFWHSCTRAVLISFGLTFFSFVDIPVFWPILLMYFIVLFFLTMKKQIEHMVKYKYVPFSWGKPKPGAGKNNK
eukprot:GSChrysophyteH1.ASY1.ANO1.3194.1 assembled CDS